MDFNLEECISSDKHDDLFEIQKMDMKRDINEASAGCSRRAFIHGVFVAGLIVGISVGISNLKSDVVFGNEGDGGDDELCFAAAKVCGACYQGCMTCNSQCFVNVGCVVHTEE
jgi:hypothetical protein